MDYFWQWGVLSMAPVALVIAGINYVRVRRLGERVEQQLRTLGQRESWQRRVQKVADHD